MLMRQVSEVSVKLYPMRIKSRERKVDDVVRQILGAYQREKRTEGRQAQGLPRLQEAGMVFIFYSDEIAIDVKTGLVTRHKN